MSSGEVNNDDYKNRSRTINMLTEITHYYYYLVSPNVVFKCLNKDISNIYRGIMGLIHNVCKVTILLGTQ